MKKWGGQLDIHPPHSKNWGGRVPPSPPGLTPLQSIGNYLQNSIIVLKIGFVQHMASHFLQHFWKTYVSLSKTAKNMSGAKM